VDEAWLQVFLIRSLRTTYHDQENKCNDKHNLLHMT
jgi:hypothetical protein